jgi:hypothetical protein
MKNEFVISNANLDESLFQTRIWTNDASAFGDWPVCNQQAIWRAETCQSARSYSVPQGTQFFFQMIFLLPPVYGGIGIRRVCCIV